MQPPVPQHRSPALPLLPLSLALFVLAPDAQASESLRCNSNLVDVGASPYELLTKCGEPAARESFTVPVRVVVSSTWTAATSTTPTGGGARRSSHGAGQSATQQGAAQQEQIVYKPVERWTYDFGPGNLLRYVELEEGRIARILVGERSPGRRP